VSPSRRLRPFAAALGFAAALAFAPAVVPQQPTAADPGAASTATVTLDFNDAPITDVIDTIAKLTGKNFLYDDRVRGNVTVISPTPVTIDEAYRVFEAILQVKGFATVPGPGGILKIVPVRTAAESAIETLPPSVSVPDRDLYITRLIPMRFVKADAIASTLRPLVSKDAQIVTYAPTNTIILTDTAANVRRLLTIIAEIDVETYQEQVKVVPIEYADAESIADHLREIFGQEREGSAGRPGRAGGAPRARAQRQPNQPQQAPQVAVEGVPGGEVVAGEVGEPRFITDERTNSIIVIAPQSTIRQVEHLITLLDYQRRGTGRIHVYRLQNADAEEMAQTLASLATGAPTSRPPGGAGGVGGAPGAGGAQGAQGSAVAELAGGVQVTADAPTNSLIIQASAEGYSAIAEVIQALDVRRPQVMVEALIMEVQVNEGEDLGSAFLYQTVFGGDPDGTRMAIGSNTGRTVVGSVDPNSTSPFLGGGDPGNFIWSILGRMIEIDDDGDPTTPNVQVPVIQGIITAAANDNDVNIISAPVILTADNEEAQIVVGQNIPIPTSQVQTPTGDAGDFNTSQNIERQDVGVTLRVTPQISEGDTVRLDIFQEISAVTDEGSELGPTTAKRTVENTVYVRDGEAVMIGGIISESDDATVDKVPFLGDIPILGWAFKSTTDQVRKINLLVILTPRIARSPQDLERLTVEQREEFRESAREKLELSEAEQRERQEALRAGIPLPIDPNPVRRELETHSERYPTRELPDLRREHAESEAARLKALEIPESGAGQFLVQVAFFRSADEAVKLLGSLIAQGYDGTVLSRTEAGEILHFVQLGPFATQDAAERIAREVRVATGRDPTVLVEP
jgi:general secretion pathway protein D